MLLELCLDEIGREIDALDPEPVSSRDAQQRAGAMDSLAEKIGHARGLLQQLLKPDDQRGAASVERLPHSGELRLKLLEAELTLLGLKLNQRGDGEATLAAREEVQSVLADAKFQHLVQLEVQCHLDLAQLASLESNDPETVKEYESAGELATSNGLPREAARAYLKLAGHWKYRDKPGLCKENVSKAIKIYSSLGDHTWVRTLQDYLAHNGCSLPGSGGGGRLLTSAPGASGP